MKETEVKLKRAIYELFRVVRMNAYMKKAQAELTELMDGSTISLRLFEGEAGATKFSEAQEYFTALADKVKTSYGTEAISAAYNSLKAALDDEEYRQTLGIQRALTSNEKSELFRKTFEVVVPKAETWDFADDFFSFYIETLKEVYMPTNTHMEGPEELCPYCDGVPQRISKAEFFGSRTVDAEGYVWGCECGAYAVMEGDKVVGRLGDTMLHQKRDLVKGALCELCLIAGMTRFESFHWFSKLTGRKLNSVADVEYLDTEDSNLALRIHLAVKQRIREMDYAYPQNRGELLLFLTDGGRLTVCNAFGFEHGRLLIPVEVGMDGFRVYGKEGKQNISFSEGMQYAFKGDAFYVIHPSGKKEKYRMMPAQIRNALLNLTREDILAAQSC